MTVCWRGSETKGSDCPSVPPSRSSSRSDARRTRSRRTYRDWDWGSTSVTRSRIDTAGGCGPRATAKVKERPSPCGCLRRPRARPTPTMCEARRILILEDDVQIATVLRDSLGDEGYEVRCVANGRDGLLVLQSWEPDLILLDLTMPMMDGPTFRSAQRMLRPAVAN